MSTVNQRGATDKGARGGGGERWGGGGGGGGRLAGRTETETNQRGAAWNDDRPHGARGGPHVHTPQGLTGLVVAKLPRYYLTVD